MPPLHYREAGGQDSANVLVLVHAFPLGSAMWRPQLEAPPDGWRIIAPDLPGFGDSPPPGGDTLGMQDAADAVVLLLNRLGVKQLVLAGLSMGGYVCLALLRRYPALLRGLILSDTRATADSDEVRRGRLQSAAKVAGGSTTELIEGMVPRLLSPWTRTNRPEVETEVRAIMETASPAGIAAALRGMAARADSTPLLRAIPVPTLVVVGEEDEITPVGEAQLLARGIPGASLERVEDAGHLPNLEQPAEFNRILHSFLASLR